MHRRKTVVEAGPVAQLQLPPKQVKPLGGRRAFPRQGLGKVGKFPLFSLEDRRVVNLELTAKGADIANQVPDIAAEVLNNRLQRFSPAEFQEFLRLLKKFAE